MTAYTSAGIIPARYVALASHGNPNFVPSYAVVRDTASGRVLAAIGPPARGTFVAVTAAASDRTFVLGEQPWAANSSDQTFEPETFYLLSLNASGRVAGLTRLPGVPVLPQGSMVTGLALSPGGHELAMAVQPAHLTQEMMQIRVYSIPGGAERTWSADGTIGASENDSGAISWTADGRTLAFDWSDGREVSVRLLDTSAGEGSLLPHSRIAVLIRTLKQPPRSSLPTAQAIKSAPPPVKDTPLAAPSTVRFSQPLGCQTDEIISPDGSVIVCGASAMISMTRTAHSIRITSRQAFIEYSVATGKMARIAGDYHGQPGDIGLYWSAAAGKVLIAAIPWPGGTSVGVISGETFTPLPGTANLGAAAW